MVGIPKPALNRGCWEITLEETANALTRDPLTWSPRESVVKATPLEFLGMLYLKLCLIEGKY